MCKAVSSDVVGCSLRTSWADKKLYCILFPFERDAARDTGGLFVSLFRKTLAVPTFQSALAFPSLFEI